MNRLLGTAANAKSPAADHHGAFRWAAPQGKHRPKRYSAARRRSGSQPEHVPLLRSLARYGNPRTINMALLAELASRLLVWKSIHAMASTYSQIYIQIVFAPQGRQSLIRPERKEELQKY